MKHSANIAFLFPVVGSCRRKHYFPDEIAVRGYIQVEIEGKTLGALVVALVSKRYDGLGRYYGRRYQRNDKTWNISFSTWGCQKRGV